MAQNQYRIYWSSAKVGSEATETIEADKYAINGDWVEMIDVGCSGVETKRRSNQGIRGETHRTAGLTTIHVGNPDRPPQVREGVKWVEDRQTDVFFITLNKSDKDYSPSTMYHDYAISRGLFHWESQSTNSSESATGQRYINHNSRGSKIAVFVRNTKKDANGRTAPYLCLGEAVYQSHTNDRPMAITWRLQNSIPAAEFLNYQAAVA